MNWLWSQCEIEREEEVRMPLRDYFQKVSAFLILLDDVAQKVRDGSYLKLSLKELQAVNRSLIMILLKITILKVMQIPLMHVKNLAKGMVSFCLFCIRSLGL